MTMEENDRDPDNDSEQLVERLQTEHDEGESPQQGGPRSNRSEDHDPEQYDNYEGEHRQEVTAGELTQEQLDKLNEDEDPDEFQFVGDDEVKPPDERDDPEP